MIWLGGLIEHQYLHMHLALAVFPIYCGQTTKQICTKIILPTTSSKFHITLSPLASLSSISGADQMPNTKKKCNLCHTELTVSPDQQVVECPACNSINGYGYSRSNQNDKYPKGPPPSTMNYGGMPNSQYQQPQFPAAPILRQTPQQLSRGGQTQQGSVYFIDTDSLLQQSPQALNPLPSATNLLQQPPQASSAALLQHSPRLANTNGFFQQSSQGSLSSQASIRTMKTNYSSFQQLSQISSVQSSLCPLKTKTPFQQPQQTSSAPVSPHPSNLSYEQHFQTSPPPVIDNPNNFFWQPQHASSPQGSPRPGYSTTSFPQISQTLPMPVPEKITNNFFHQTQQTSSPQGSPHSPYSNISYQQPFQKASQPVSDKAHNFSWQPQQTSSPHGSPRPAYSTSSLQPLQTPALPTYEKTNNVEEPQQTSSSPSSSRPPYSNLFYQQPLQTSSPPTLEKTNNFSQQPQQASSPQGSPLPAYSNTSYHQPLQTSSPPVLEKTNNFVEKPQQASPQGSPRPAYGNTSYQQQLQSSPQEPPHQPQTSPPQGSSPRPSRFSSFLRPQTLQTPGPQGSPPQGHSKNYNQKTSQSSTPPKEHLYGPNQQLIQTSPQISSSQVQPSQPATRLQVSNNGHQKQLQDTKPVSAASHLAREQHIQYGMNHSTSGTVANPNSRSADHQKSMDATAVTVNPHGAPANNFNETETDDEHNYTKRRLKEFRKQLQI